MSDKLKGESFDDVIRETLESMGEGKAKSSRTSTGKKVPGKYLTKDKAAMKGEIERVSKLKSDDPSAYGKWQADYKGRDTKSGKPHKTKKSAATLAYEKKFGKKKNENTEMEELINEKTDAMIKNKAKASGISASILRQVYSRGAAAWKSGHRPGVSQQQWAAGRVNSFITGSGGARKADADLWAKAKKSKKRKNESANEAKIRKLVRSILVEMHDEKGVGTISDLTGVDVTSILPYSDLLNSLGRDLGWGHELTQQVAYSLEIKSPSLREKRIIDLLNDYDVYDDYAHYLRLNEKEGIGELYPLMVGEDSMEEGIGKYVAGAALGLGLALGSPGKALAQQTQKDDTNKPKIVKTLQNLKKSVFDKKIEPEPEEDASGKKVKAAFDSLSSQVGKVVKTADGKYSTVEMEEFDSLGDASEFSKRIATRRAQSAIATAAKGKEVSPGRTVTSGKVTDSQTEERLFQNPDGTFTYFVKVSAFVN